MNPFVTIGVLLNSALYLTGCFVAGLVTANAMAWRLALASAGVTYVCYLIQPLGLPRPAVICVVAISIVLGLGAGLSLLGA